MTSARASRVRGAARRPGFLPRLVCALFGSTAPLAPALAADGAAAPEWGGAVTLVASRSPDYLGARDSGTSLRPGFLLTWGRVTLSSGGGFAATRQDKVVRGLGVELARTDQLRVNLGLRFDGGRSEADSPALAGMGDVKATVRARVGASWQLDPLWRVEGSWTVDAFHRGGGNLVELSLEREQWIAERTQLSWGTAATVGGPRYLRTYFGVTPEQSALTGYAPYAPSLGLRDISAFVSLKTDIGAHFVVMGAVSVSRVVGPAADSPLVVRPTGWGLTTGLGYRF